MADEVQYRLEELEAENARLREALWQFGAHRPDCRYPEARCDCGLHAAIIGPKPGHRRGILGR